MPSLTFRFGFPLAIALAMSGTAAVAQQSDQAPGVQIDAGKVQQTIVQLSEYGTPIERFWVDRKVSFADLDLATIAGSAELMRRVTEAAKEGCAQVHAADPVDLSDTDDASCVRTAKDGALKQVNAVIEQRRKSTARLSTPG
jgi:UrcA family protein